MSKKSLIVCVLPILFTIGCVETHHPPVVYTPSSVPVETPVVVAPTSDRPGVRVYPSNGTVSSRDLAIADSIREVMRGEVVIPSVGNNVEARVDHGVVTLTGTVPSDSEKDELVSRISHLPGVVEVHDRTTTTLR